ncbi:MAG: hypothetical protein QHJ73_04270, partial [Armatimonadota bacterium]|nr:hypothetical protein [Armatimonadota bacterium]
MSMVERVGRAPSASADFIDIPNLIEIQTDSYRWFLEEGLRELFRNFSPIEDPTGTYALYLDDYALKEPKYTIEECRDRDVTYERPISAKIRLVNKKSGEILVDDVYLGDLPVMTEKGTFVINGAERVVVSQLARSPGVYFRDNIDYSGRVLYSAQVIPAEGAWIEVETDANDVISVRIGQTRKFPITTLLRALNAFDHDGAGAERPQTATTYQLYRLFGQVRTIENPTVENLLPPESDGTVLRVYQEIADLAGREPVAFIVHGEEEEDWTSLGFSSRDELKKVPGMGPATFTQAAGFLKVPCSDNLLDNTFIHPESYEVARKLIDRLPPARDGEKLPQRVSRFRREMETKGITVDQLAAELGTGAPTLKDILDNLEKPGLDPRDSLPK